MNGEKMLTLGNVINNFKAAKVGPKILFFVVLVLFIGGLVALSLAGFRLAMIFLFIIVFGLAILVILALFIFISIFTSDIIDYIFKGERHKDNLLVKWFHKKDEN